MMVKNCKTSLGVGSNDTSAAYFPHNRGRRIFASAPTMVAWIVSIIQLPALTMSSYNSHP